MVFLFVKQWFRGIVKNPTCNIQHINHLGKVTTLVVEIEVLRGNIHVLGIILLK